MQANEQSFDDGFKENVINVQNEASEESKVVVAGKEGLNLKPESEADCDNDPASKVAEGGEYSGDKKSADPNLEEPSCDSYPAAKDEERQAGDGKNQFEEKEEVRDVPEKAVERKEESGGCQVEVDKGEKKETNHLNLEVPSSTPEESRQQSPMSPDSSDDLRRAMVWLFL
jgi:hypothetical protein